MRKLGRPPTEAKIADEAGLEAAEYCDFLDQYSCGQVTSQLRSQFVDAISQLEECNEPFALFYFYEGLTMKEVSKPSLRRETHMPDPRAQLIMLRGLLQGSAAPSGS